ncbi:hypothetical protein NPIL_390531 [Nephila pilipes]|uniref:Uncharacterized protein n=1 Tax=Nephila pilipes TaxID=299642 RepID=A0A8X6MS25_NEPPI|nr:hypothetical protein NPIL_390531 [Nephila pilipes]
MTFVKVPSTITVTGELYHCSLYEDANYHRELLDFKATSGVPFSRMLDVDDASKVKVVISTFCLRGKVLGDASRISVGWVAGINSSIRELSLCNEQAADGGGAGYREIFYSSIVHFLLCQHCSIMNPEKEESAYYVLYFTCQIKECRFL